MRTPSRASLATLVGLTVCIFVLTGCHGSPTTSSTGPANTQVNPGPNSTTGDPGPNNTANGPQTLQGTIAAHAGCVELTGNAANAPAARYQLEFTADTVTRKGSTFVLSGTDGDHTVGPRDVVYVAGHPGSGTGPCGRVFRVEKVVAVTPG